MSVLVNSDVREGLSVRKTPLVIYSPLRHSVLRAFPMKISWLQARACAPQTVAALALQGPSVMFLSSVFLPVICQRQKGSGVEGGGVGGKTFFSFLFSVCKATARQAWCCTRAETRIQTHAAPQCCCAIRGKRHDAAVRAASHPRSQNKHNSNQVTNKALRSF